MFAFNAIWPSFYDAPFFEFFNSILDFCTHHKASSNLAPHMRGMLMGV